MSILVRCISSSTIAYLTKVPQNGKGPCQRPESPIILIEIPKKFTLSRISKQEQQSTTETTTQKFESIESKGLSGSRSGDIFFNSDYNEVLKFGVFRYSISR